MDVSEVSQELAEVMANQLRVRGGRLADVAARAGRKLPRHLQAEAQAIVEAETLAAEGIEIAPILFPIAEPDELN